MVDAVTSNRSLTLPTVGGDSGTWGNVLNSGTFTQVDLVFGNTQSITLTSSDVTLSQVQWNNLAQTITGTFTGNRNLYLPFSPNSTTAAVGGLFVVENNSTGSFNLTVSTTASGATGVVAYNGLRTLLYSDQTNVKYADDSAARFTPTNGNPNGTLAGTAATLNNPPHPLAFDYSGGTGAWVPTTTGTATSTVWAQLAGIGAALPVPEGYLTPVSSTPIITSDSTSATVIYYTPFAGTWTLVHNGSLIIPYQFSQMQLTLTSSQAANNIYDIFLAYNGGTPVIGTGPSWSAGTGGNITAGSCVRGTGAGGTTLARTQGVWTNNVQISLIYNTGSGNNTIPVPVNQGIYLGSIYIDATAGQATNHVSWGQNRKRALWNAYNKSPIVLQSGDPSSGWVDVTAAVHASNGAPGVWASTSYNVGSGVACNGLSVLCGLPEEFVAANFIQAVPAQSSSQGTYQIGIGLNSVSAFSGTVCTELVGGNSRNFFNASFYNPPALGINTYQACAALIGGASMNPQGTQAGMNLSVQYRG